MIFITIIYFTKVSTLLCSRAKVGGAGGVSMGIDAAAQGRELARHGDEARFADDTVLA